MNVHLCRICKRPIAIVRKASDKTAWVVIEATPVETLLMDSNRCWVIAGQWAHRPAAIEQLIQTNREVSIDEARKICRLDFAWHLPHDCPNRDVQKQESA